MRIKKSTFLIWTIILIDLLSGLLLTLQVPFARVGLVIKGAVIIFILISCLTHLRKKTFISIYLSMAILFIFWVVGFFTSLSTYSGFEPAESLVVLNRYFFFLIMCCAFLDWAENDYFEAKCKKILETFFTINNAFIFVGFIFKIKMLSTYDPYGEYGDNWRFGYKGLIWGQNAVAAIYTLGIAYFFRENFKYQLDKKLGLITTCVAAVLVGTKATWITLILIAGYYLYKYRIKTLVVLVIPACAGLAYLFISNWEVLKQKYFNFLVAIYESTDFITFFTSGRDNLLKKAILHIDSHWTFINFIVGDAISYVEMDFFDLYFYFGLSAIIYLFIYIKIYFIKDRSRDHAYIFVVWMAMAFVSGHIINSAIVPIFFLLFVFSAQSATKANISLNKNSNL